MTALVGRQAWAIAALLAAGLFICGCGNSAAGSDTPEAAFQKWQDAGQAKDYGTLYDCMTEKAQNQIAGGTVMMMAFAGMGMDQAQQDEGKAILAKHNLDKVDLNAKRSGSPAEQLAALGTAIKDKRGFVVEAMTWVDKHSGKKTTKTPDGGTFTVEVPSPSAMGEGTLSDVKINGDAATGTVTKSKGGKTRPMTFQKVSGSWLIDGEG